MSEVNKAKKNSRKSDLPKTGFLILVAIASGFFGGYFGGQNNDNSNEVSVTRQVIEGESNLINTIAKDVSPSVVSVNVTNVSVQRDLFGFSSPVESQSAGTGVIISKDGLIITNRHVLPSDGKVSITLSDGKEVDNVEIVGKTNQSDPLDIAFLKITDTSDLELVPANLGDSDSVEVGDRAVAIGNALGQFQNTVTSGIISGFGRDIEAFDGGGIETLQNLFQTDAAINGGNSGGPLVNAASQVIGINVATASAENISFAIPINDVKPLIDIVLETGKLERPYLGVRYVPLNETVAKELGIDVTNGAYIPESSADRPSIVDGSPAAKAGLQEKDTIIEINGRKIDEKNSLVSILGSARVGQSVDLKIQRGSEVIDIKATLEASPNQ